MGLKKVRIRLIMAFGAEIAKGILGHELKVGAMGSMTGSAILCSGWMQ